MSLHVTDVRSNSQDQIAHAAKLLHRSPHALIVFRAVYTGKTKVKTIRALVKATGLTDKQILMAGGKLVGDELIGVHKVKVEGRIAYTKDPFYNRHRLKILRLAANQAALKKFPTKYNRQAESVRLVLDIRKKSIQASLVTVDDIDSFSHVKSVKEMTEPRPLPELPFKAGVKAILNETGDFQDWGGEQNDLFTTRVEFKGQRVAAAFGFKGKGTKGILTPKKMGRNGDQIQRLFRSPATMFLVQYWGQIDQSVLEQMNALATAKSFIEGNQVYYGVIDGEDTQRLVSAYRDHFKSMD